jgi:ATP-dependent DNA ligase
MELNGRDLRTESLDSRRERLRQLLAREKMSRRRLLERRTL